ncbi:unnamed protein product, partial [Mesorhabditis spiculigera]
MQVKRAREIIIGFEYTDNIVVRVDDRSVEWGGLLERFNREMDVTEMLRSLQSAKDLKLGTAYLDKLEQLSNGINISCQSCHIDYGIQMVERSLSGLVGKIRINEFVKSTQWTPYTDIIEKLVRANTGTFSQHCATAAAIFWTLKALLSVQSALKRRTIYEILRNVNKPNLDRARHQFEEAEMILKELDPGAFSILEAECEAQLLRDCFTKYKPGAVIFHVRFFANTRVGGPNYMLSCYQPEKSAHEVIVSLVLQLG